MRSDGEYFGSVLLDGMASAVGAFSFRDGVGTGGYPFDPRVPCPNVEQTEQTAPLLYLYRYEAPNSGGAGRFRGGNSAVVGFVIHGIDSITHGTVGGGGIVPTATGLFGGYPATTSKYTMKRSTNVREVLAGGTIPRSLSALTGTEERLSSRSNGEVEQGVDDVYEWIWNGGGGYGDPLQREPERVVADVLRRDVTAEVAHDLFGVVLADGDRLDEDATKARRETILKQRQEQDPTCRADAAADRARRAYNRRPVQRVPRDRAVLGGEAVIRCTCCGHLIAEHGSNYLDGLALADLPVTVVPAVQPTEQMTDDAFSLRQHYCPGCHVLVSNEIKRADDTSTPDSIVLTDG